MATRNSKTTLYQKRARGTWNGKRAKTMKPQHQSRGTRNRNYR